MTLLAILVLGFFLGMRHATDTDHVVAVSTIVSRERNARAALLLGALWGLGHTLTIVIVGGAIIVLGLVIPPRLGLSMEMSVAVMLVVLGAMNLSGSLQRIDEVREGESHAGSHKRDLAREREGNAGTSAVRPVIVGIVHGLAGSAGVALLVLATIREAAWGMLYLTVFGLGTVVGMMTLTFAMSWPIALASRRFANSHSLLAKVTGLASVLVGLFLAYQIGVVEGLFVGVPNWQPK
jgi:high-affinity nickel-transport protein